VLDSSSHAFVREAKAISKIKQGCWPCEVKPDGRVYGNVSIPVELWRFNRIDDIQYKYDTNGVTKLEANESSD